MDGFTGGCVTMDLYLGNMTGRFWVKLQDQSHTTVSENLPIMYQRKFSFENVWNTLSVDVWSLTGKERLLFEIDTLDPERGVVATFDNIIHTDNKSCSALGRFYTLNQTILPFMQKCPPPL